MTDKKTRKRLEAKLLAEEERAKKALDGAKDTGVGFEATGIDYLFLDEAHAYKRLRTPSNTTGMGIPEGSQRAADLAMKLRYLRQSSGTDRVVCFATATPITNTIAEIYVMQQFLRPDILEHAGIDDFDTWAATFGKTITSIEIAPEGTGFREHARFAKFINVPELLTMFNIAADIKTGDDLDLDTPQIAGGAPETVVIEPSGELTDYMDDLASRAHDVRQKEVRPDQDNMLKITGDGRKAALDLRLVGRDQPAPSKAETAADRIAGIYHATKDTRYLDAHGEPHPVPGALQIVFCDLSTPKDDWNVYDHLTHLLLARGVPEAEIRYVQHAKKPAEKAALFEACRTGGVAVLLGSTETMGVGTNVQTRAVALHHMDCHWLPAMIAQREGRIIRQGNQNAGVQILRYVTEASFDAYMWQTVERKATFIAQVMRGRLDVREIEDIGDQALSYAEVKALATGNPLLLDKAEADADLAKLQRLERSHERNQHDLRRTIETARHHIDQIQNLVTQIDTAIGTRQDTTGDKFTMRIGPTQYTERPDAGDHLKQAVKTIAEDDRRWETTPIGQLGGLALQATLEPRLKGKVVVLSFTDAPVPSLILPASQIGGSSQVGLVRQLENRLAGLEDDRDHHLRELDREHHEIHQAEQQIGTPFPRADEFEAARARVADLQAQLAAESTPDDPGHQPTTPTAPTPTSTTTTLATSRRPPGAEHGIRARPAETGNGPASAVWAHPEGSRQTASTRESDGEHGPRPPGEPPGDTRAEPDSRGEPATTDAGAPPQDSGDGSAPRVVTGRTGTRVIGTSRHDRVLRAELKRADFRWSRQGFWYLPRTWLHSTRNERVKRLVEGLQRHQRRIDVQEEDTMPDRPAGEPTRHRAAPQASDNTRPFAGSEPATIAGP